MFVLCHFPKFLRQHSSQNVDLTFKKVPCFKIVVKIRKASAKTESHEHAVTAG